MALGIPILAQVYRAHHPFENGCEKMAVKDAFYSGATINVNLYGENNKLPPGLDAIKNEVGDDGYTNQVCWWFVGFMIWGKKLE